MVIGVVVSEPLERLWYCGRQLCATALGMQLGGRDIAHIPSGTSTSHSHAPVVPFSAHIKYGLGHMGALDRQDRI